MKKLYPAEQFGMMIGDMMSTNERVDLLFTALQVEQLKLIANMPAGCMRGKRVGRLSGQDALSAYIITIFNQCQDIPIRRMSNILSVSAQSLLAALLIDPISFQYRQTQPSENPNDWKPPGSDCKDEPIKLHAQILNYRGRKSQPSAMQYFRRSQIRYLRRVPNPFLQSHGQYANLSSTRETTNMRRKPPRSLVQPLARWRVRRRSTNFGRKMVG